MRLCHHLPVVDGSQRQLAHIRYASPAESLLYAARVSCLALFAVIVVQRKLARLGHLIRKDWLMSLGFGLLNPEGIRLPAMAGIAGAAYWNLRDGRGVRSLADALKLTDNTTLNPTFLAPFTFLFSFISWSARYSFLNDRRSLWKISAYFCSDFSTARKAVCGISTFPTVFILFLPAFCFSSSFLFLVISPP